MYDFNKNNLITVIAEVEKKEEDAQKEEESPHIRENLGGFRQ